MRAMLSSLPRRQKRGTTKRRIAAYQLLMLLLQLALQLLVLAQVLLTEAPQEQQIERQRLTSAFVHQQLALHYPRCCVRNLVARYSELVAAAAVSWQ